MTAAPQRDHIRRRISHFGNSLGSPVPRVSTSSSVDQPPVSPERNASDLTQQVGDTIAAAERAIASLGALRTTTRTHRDEAEALQREIDAGKLEERRLKHRLAELEKALAIQRAGTAEAEHRAREVDANIDEMERRIDRMRAETRQLLDAATLLLSKEAEPSAQADVPRRALRRSSYAA